MFAREPVSGKVKTRLSPHISSEKAADLYKAFIVDIVNNLKKLKGQDLTIAYAPVSGDADAVFHELVGESIPLFPQKGDTLGERLKNAFQDSFCKEIKRIVIIGADSPTLPISYIKQAFHALRDTPVVIGPAYDGGYYLIGLSGFTGEIFDGIEWGSPQVFSQTIERIKELNQQLHLLPPWYDIDTPSDLSFLRSHLVAMKLSGSREIPHNTAQFLENFIENSSF
ncbi:MAG: TIGR04282 family arsenosugar biosynthesis glycosyltransferase [Candidatus Scalindua sp.]|nr:TIGR04282 family arsenosugar biosynthesis glycosyltransferase [Candidatus Scalindua sp.]